MLATTVPFYNISTLYNRNEKIKYIHFRKVKEPHATFEERHAARKPSLATPGIED